MSRPQPSKAATFGQLCVIAREQIQAEPSIDDSEWKARIKDRLIALRFECPPNSEAIGRAMSAVLEKQWGPRPTPVTPTCEPVTALPLQQDPPWRRHERQDPAFTALQELMLQLIKNLPRSET